MKLQSVAHIIRSSFRKGAPARLLEALADGCVKLKPSLARRYAPPASTHGAVMPLLLSDGRKSAMLDQIPSQTTRAERRFLYHFFSQFWTGQNVLEVGPFLGGTTRAIALGMLDNPRRAPQASLHTYDRFRYYMSGQSLRDFIAPLLANGELAQRDVDEMGESADFEAIFNRVHGKHEYNRLIRCVSAPLPDLPEELDATDNLFQPPAGITFDAVFIDGCKSWFGTRYFMQSVVPQAQVGAWFIFQDYAHHPCFWIPAFLGTFRNAFQLGLYVDSTYAFQLRQPLTVRDIQARFPESPDAWEEKQFEDLFRHLMQEACDRDDPRAQIVYAIQWAAALAYVGKKAAARRILNDLDRTPGSDGVDDWIRNVGYLTYYPGKTGSRLLKLDELP